MKKDKKKKEKGAKNSEKQKKSKKTAKNTEMPGKKKQDKKTKASTSAKTSKKDKTAKTGAVSEGKRVSNKPKAIRISMRIAKKVTSITLNPNIVALWLVFCTDDDPSDKGLLKSRVNEFVGISMKKWDREDAQGLSEYIGNRMVKACLDDKDFKLYKKFGKTLTTK